jgi:hypothetical protein
MAEAPSGFIDIAEWARVNGMSARRARQLASSGRISAEKHGGRWLLADPQPARRPTGSVGRPLSERSVWAIVDVLDGIRPPALSRTEIARAKQRAASAADFAPGDLAQRADVLHLRSHPGVLAGLSADERVVVGGAGAASAHGADLIDLSRVELYVLREDAQDVMNDFALQPVGRGANVVLRASHRLPRSIDRLASASVAALDLLDAGDERSVRAARGLLEVVVTRAFGGLR